MGKRGRRPLARGPRMGPGTTIALVICGVAVALGRATRKPHYPGEHAWRERPASHASEALLPAPPPLVKPDPSYILDRAGELRLTLDEQRRVAAIDAEWRKQKERLSQAMEAASEPVRAQPAGSVEDLSTKLGGYSDLSREFDARRRQAWGDARRVLTAEQLGRLDKTLPGGGGR